MRICLDARRISHVAEGHGRYEEQLVRGLATIDRENDYIVVLNTRYRDPVVEQANFSRIHLPEHVRIFETLLVGAPGINRLGADIYHSLNYHLPRGIQARTVITLHDLFPYEYSLVPRSENVKTYVRRRLSHTITRVAMRQTAARADHIISVSHHTAVLANTFLRTGFSRITVIGHGVVDRFLHPETVELPNGTPRDLPYFLVLGNSSWNKNVRRVIHAMARLKTRLPEARLLVIGRGDEYASLRAYARRLGVEDRVRLMAQVTDDDLVHTVRRAIALVFPSLAEGFGIPIVEAQALGCPVITSDRGAPFETAGDAALFADPYDSGEIADAMVRLYQDPRLRASLAEKGRIRARQMTWQRAAQKTLEVYEKVMKRAARRGTPTEGSPASAG